MEFAQQKSLYGFIWYIIGVLAAVGTALILAGLIVIYLKKSRKKR